jgi:hypothetical protein
METVLEKLTNSKAKMVEGKAPIEKNILSFEV